MSTSLPQAGPDPGVLSEEFYAAIGVVVVRWSLLEEAANIAIAGILKTTVGDFLPVAANLQGQTRFNVLAAAGQQNLSPDAYQKIVELLRPIEKLIADRNKVVHGAWRSTNDPKVCVLLTARARGKLNLKGSSITIDSLVTLGNSIGIVKDNLIKFLDAEGVFPAAYSPPASAPPPPRS